MSSILGYERKIQVILDNNWKQFRDFAASGKAIDMDHWATYFAYDIVSELALGNALGMVTKGSDVNYVMESVLGLFYMLSNLGHVPFQGWVVMNPVSQWFFATFGNDSMKGAGRFRAWLTESVQKRYYSTDKPTEKDMLQHFIEATDRDGNPNQFPHVLSECGNGADPKFHAANE
jgi:hypothetical protein